MLGPAAPPIGHFRRPYVDYQDAKNQSIEEENSPDDLLIQWIGGRYGSVLWPRRLPHVAADISCVVWVQVSQ